MHQSTTNLNRRVWAHDLEWRSSEESAEFVNIRMHGLKKKMMLEGASFTNSLTRYSIQLEEDYIYIIAIAHCHRRPDYWIDRIFKKF